MDTSRAADNALVVLLAVAEGAVTASELSRITGLNRTVVHRMTATLVGRGFISRGAGGRYILGPTMTRFSRSPDALLRDLSRGVMRELAEATGETVVLSVPDDGEVVSVERVVGVRHALRVDQPLGVRRAMTRGAGQRAILAFSAGADIDRAVEGLEDAAEIRRRLDETRRAGYTVSLNELSTDVSAVAAPVLVDSRPLGSLAVVTPLVRAGQLDTFVSPLLDAARQLSTALSRYAPPPEAV